MNKVRRSIIVNRSITLVIYNFVRVRKPSLFGCHTNSMGHLIEATHYQTEKSEISNNDLDYQQSLFVCIQNEISCFPFISCALSFDFAV